MSKGTAISDEQASRAYDLKQEISTKLSQARGICGMLIHVQDMDEPIAESLSAAEDLIEGAQKAFDELRGIYHPKAGQQPS